MLILSQNYILVKVFHKFLILIVVHFLNIYILDLKCINELLSFKDFF